MLGRLRGGSYGACAERARGCMHAATFSNSTLLPSPQQLLQSAAVAAATVAVAAICARVPWAAAASCQCAAQM